ncbi:50S ribosomal protein L6 [Candidatus Uhrbacteria bacterium]|nr:50S ribosomal protein L6 [Candidatus Uhrbacteria bacterium]
MSRIGKQPVIIPNGVTVSVQGQTVTVKGPKGELVQEFNPAVKVVLNEKEGQKDIVVTVANETDKFVRAQWGTARAILQNMVKGVVEVFSIQLEVNGVGYRVNMKGKDIVLNIGFSHEIPFIIPKGIEASVEGNIITIKGADKHLVGEIAANIRRIRKPEPYKGKGIKYVGEVVRRKSGKAQKAAA